MLKLPSELVSCLSGGQCCSAHLRFDLREPCLGGCQSSFCLWHKREGVRVRPLSHSQVRLSGGKSLASFASHQMLSPLLPCIGRNCFDGFPGCDCTS